MERSGGYRRRTLVEVVGEHRRRAARLLASEFSRANKQWPCNPSRHMTLIRFVENQYSRFRAASRRSLWETQLALCRGECDVSRSKLQLPARLSSRRKFKSAKVIARTIGPMNTPSPRKPAILLAAQKTQTVWRALCGCQSDTGATDCPPDGQLPVPKQGE